MKDRFDNFTEWCYWHLPKWVRVLLYAAIGTTAIGLSVAAIIGAGHLVITTLRRISETYGDEVAIVVAVIIVVFALLALNLMDEVKPKPTRKPKDDLLN